MSTISTSGIAPSSVIRAEHVLRVINALSNNANNDILISGSLTVTGSTALSGSLNVTGGITGSIFGTSSNATSASYAVNSRNATSASYALTASYAVSASYEISYEVSSSYAESATSASYALTASYALNSPGGGTTDTGSLLLTASATDNIITFTKGDASTFNITVNTGSASSINTGSFATTGSNQFSGSQGITGSITIADSDLSLAMNQNFITFENLNSPNDIGVITRLGSTYSEGGNTQAFLFPSSPTGGYKTITLPNATGTVALTYNTATTGSNQFSGSQGITGSITLGEDNFVTTLQGGNIKVENTSTSGYIETQNDLLRFTKNNSGLKSLNLKQAVTPLANRTIYFPDEDGTIAMKGANTFTGNQIITGSVSISGSGFLNGYPILTSNDLNSSGSNVDSLGGVAVRTLYSRDSDVVYTSGSVNVNFMSGSNQFGSCTLPSSFFDESINFVSKILHFRAVGKFASTAGNDTNASIYLAVGNQIISGSDLGIQTLAFSTNKPFEILGEVIITAGSASACYSIGWCDQTGDMRRTPLSDVTISGSFADLTPGDFKVIISGSTDRTMTSYYSYLQVFN